MPNKPIPNQPPEPAPEELYNQWEEKDTAPTYDPVDHILETTHFTVEEAEFLQWEYDMWDYYGNEIKDRLGDISDSD